jgi:hypothetical protein
MPQGDQLPEDVPEGTRAASCRVPHPVKPATPQHCRLLPPRASQAISRSSPIHGILWQWRSRSCYSRPHQEESICRGSIRLEHLLAAGHGIVSLPLWRQPARDRQGCVGLGAYRQTQNSSWRIDHHPSGLETREWYVILGRRPSKVLVEFC